MSGLKKNLVFEYSPLRRRQMVDPSYKDIPVSVQASLLEVNRTSLYYRPKEYDEEDLKVKADIDRIYTAHPEFGYRRITVWLNKYEACRINHKAVLRHMRQMGIQAVYPRSNTSKPNPANKIYPYLLKGLTISRPDHVWSVDITYIPIRRSFLYLVAIIDWHSRYVVSWMLDDTLDIGFVLDAGRNALRASRPEIMNSDQGSHFTSPKFTGIFIEAGARISMDHRGRAFDNIFIERLWRTLKYENVYLMGYETPRDARAGINRYLHYYNNQRPHQSLGYRTPEDVYFNERT